MPNEMLNELDYMNACAHHANDTLSWIITLEWKSVAYDLLRDKDNVKKYILDESFDEAYGARPIKRFITNHIETFIATKIIKGEIKPGIPYVLDACNGEIRLLLK